MRLVSALWIRRLFCFCWVSLCLVLAVPSPALAASKPQRLTVVVIGTEGEKAWLAAERRLLAELDLLPIRIQILPGRVEADRHLPELVAKHSAFAGVQTLREGEEGVIRLWLAAGRVERAGYQHARVYLRGVDQVGPAVSEIFERIHGRFESAALPSESNPRAVGRAPLRSPAPMRHRRPTFVPSSRVAQVFPEYAALVGSGPWFSGGDAAPAFSLAGRFGVRWAPRFAGAVEGFVHLLRHELSREQVSGAARIFGGRLMFALYPWPNGLVNLGIEAGPVWTGLVGSGPVVNFASAVGGSTRVALSAPVRPGLALCLTATSTWGLPQPRWADGAAGFHFGSMAFEGQVAAEWTWH